MIEKCFIKNQIMHRVGRLAFLLERESEMYSDDQIIFVNQISILDHDKQLALNWITGQSMF